MVEPLGCQKGYANTNLLRFEDTRPCRNRRYHPYTPLCSLHSMCHLLLLKRGRMAMFPSRRYSIRRFRTQKLSRIPGGLGIHWNEDHPDHNSRYLAKFG